MGRLDKGATVLDAQPPDRISARLRSRSREAARDGCLQDAGSKEDDPRNPRRRDPDGYNPPNALRVEDAEPCETG